MIEELLLVERSEALVHVDFLPRGGRGIGLTEQVVEQVSGFARTVVDAIEPLQGQHLFGIDSERGLEAARRLGQEIFDLLLVDLADLHERFDPVAPRERLGAPVDDRRQHLEIARSLGDTRGPSDAFTWPGSSSKTSR